MLPIGTLLDNGHYRIEQYLASGGFGNTYKVTNTAFGETLAVKEFFIRGVNQRTGQTISVTTDDNHRTFELQKEKFEKEARRLRKLDSPHLVKVHDLFEENGTSYYVMDFIDGENLSQIIQRSGPLDETYALGIVGQMLDVLDTLHSDNPPLCHLDIKPSNIMVDKKGNAFLIDFGSSKQFDVDEGVTMNSGLAHTQSYAPLELVNGDKERIGPWTDFYELGATLYCMLTAHRPPNAALLSENPREAFTFPPTVSSHTIKLVQWMMSLNRNRRPQSVNAVRAYLNNNQEDETVYGGGAQPHVIPPVSPSNNSGEKVAPVTPPIAPSDNEPSSSSNWKKYAIIVAVVLGIGLLAFLIYSLLSSGASKPSVAETEIGPGAVSEFFTNEDSDNLSEEDVSEMAYEDIDFSPNNIFTVLYAISDDGYVVLRSDRSAKSDSLETIYQMFGGLGNGVLLGQEGNWLGVRVLNTEGWAYADYLNAQTWYDGSETSVLVAKSSCTMIYRENYEDDSEMTEFSWVKAGTVIADVFDEDDELYILSSAHDDLYIKKEDCVVVSKKNEKRKSEGRKDSERASVGDSSWSGSHRLTGSFYNARNSWPVTFSFTVQADGTISDCTYRNVSQNVTISSMYGQYNSSNGSLFLSDRNNTLYLQLSRNGSGSFNGTATSGSTTLSVSLKE